MEPRPRDVFLGAHVTCGIEHKESHQGILLLDTLQSFEGFFYLFWFRSVGGFRGWQI
jgi:hypothetical protein